jgi:hypothetical protein
VDALGAAEAAEGIYHSGGIRENGVVTSIIREFLERQVSIYLPISLEAVTYLFPKLYTDSGTVSVGTPDTYRVPSLRAVFLSNP